LSADERGGDREREREGKIKGEIESGRERGRMNILYYMQKYRYTST
jgi:hypothetical protein